MVHNQFLLRAFGDMARDVEVNGEGSNQNTSSASNNRALKILTVHIEIKMKARTAEFQVDHRQTTRGAIKTACHKENSQTERMNVQDSDTTIIPVSRGR